MSSACGGRRECRCASTASAARRGTAPRAAPADTRGCRAARTRPPRPERPAARPVPRRRPAFRSRPRARCRSAPARRPRARRARLRPSRRPRAVRCARARTRSREALRMRRARARRAPPTTRPRSRTRRPPSGADRLQPRRRPQQRSPRAASRDRFKVIPFGGCGFPSRSSAASRRCSVCGPIPETDVSRPARAATRNSSAVETPSAFPISTIRFGPTPRKRPSPISSGCTSRSSSSSSAMRPVSTSSRKRVAIPGPIPRSSWTRPAATSSAIGAFVSRIVSAARR